MKKFARKTNDPFEKVGFIFKLILHLKSGTLREEIILNATQLKRTFKHLYWCLDLIFNYKFLF